MKSVRKASITASIIGLLIAVYGLVPILDVSAQHEHRHSHASANAKNLKNPLAATEENIARGRSLFAKQCASCHGADGKAMTETASALKVKPADLTQLHGPTGGEIYWVITKGINASGMPAFETRISERERWLTGLFVEHVQGQHQHGATESTTAGSKQDKSTTDHTQHQHQPQTDQKTHQQHEAQADHNMQAEASEMAGGAHAGHNMMTMIESVTGGPFRTMQAIGS